MSVAVDKITTIDVIMHKIEAICRFMADVLIRTSYSPLFSDQNDFSTALFTRDGKLMAMNLGCPVHIAAMPFSVKAALEEFKDDIYPGDVLFLNDPYRGGTHVPDYTFITPVFLDDELIGFAATRAHVQDAGSAEPDSTIRAIHIVQEGVRVPPVKLYEKGKPTDVVKILISMTRLPYYMAGDIKAAVEGSNKMGAKMLQDLYRRYGKRVMEVAIEEILNYAERRVRRAIREIPEGTYEAEDYLDSDIISDNPVRFKVTITVKGDEMIVDWTGTSGPVLSPINRPKHATIGDTIYVLKALLDPKGTLNDGIFRPIKVIIPEGSLLDAKWPYPVTEGNLFTSSMIVDVIMQALARAMPQKVMGMMAPYVALIVSGIDPKTGEWFVFDEMPPGGWGGRATKDGNSVVWHMLGNCRDLPVEVMEAIYPVRVAFRELICDSGGPGKFRGGLGMRVGIIGLTKFNCTLELCMRVKHGPPGVLGGMRGRTVRAYIIYPDGRREVHAGWRENGSWDRGAKYLQDLPPGTMVVLETAGGGGYGDALERDPRLVLEDVLDNYVSFEAAEKIFGVRIDPIRMEIDWDATKKLRENMKRKRTK